MKIMDISDWDSFLAFIRSPLPACFRINSDCAYADWLKTELHRYADQFQDLVGPSMKPVKVLTWFPDGMAFQLGMDRQSIRREPRLDAFHKWMVSLTDSGAITRQEAVSMIPPVVLQVEPQHRVLDMCAAPGSKTSQILEVIQSGMGGDPLHPKEPTGMVVANDSDTQRAYMLVHQCNRLKSPGLCIITHKGQFLPNLCRPANIRLAPGDDLGNLGDRVEGGTRAMFDRVLCDVPCSGDGTLRKQNSIWGSWSTASGISLHPLQLSIAMRGVALLEVGGLLVYSTCSLNPIEDEAVIAALLTRGKGSLELVDASSAIPGFKCRPGLLVWPFLDEQLSNRANKRIRMQAKFGDAVVEAPGAAAVTDGACLSSPNAEYAAEVKSEGAMSAEDRHPAGVKSVPPDPELAAAKDLGLLHFESFDDVPAEHKGRVRETMFAPDGHQAKSMHLERCMRCLPQDEDTGGFFVALIRKVAAPVSSAVTPSSASASASDSVSDSLGIEERGLPIDRGVTVPSRKRDIESAETEVATKPEMEDNAKRCKLEEAEDVLGDSMTTAKIVGGGANANGSDGRSLERRASQVVAIVSFCIHPLTFLL